MELGKVKGQVVATVRDQGLANLKLLLLDLVDTHGNVLASDQVAADLLGAGEGELVLLVRGSSARRTMGSEPPLDLCVIGIVDQVTANKTAIYKK
jgi:microcompartment protein CcmK/EutM